MSVQNYPRLAIISTHPIQYNAPLFRKLAAEPWLQLKVFYTWSQRRDEDRYDKDFGKEISWDIPLLEGYDYTFVPNHAKHPGNKGFKGIVCPSLIDEIRQWEASHLLVYGWNFQAHLGAMRYFKGRIPVIFRGDSTLLDEQPGIKQTLRRRLLKWVYRKTDYALYVGQANKQYFLAHGLKEKQLYFAPHAIDNQRFLENDAARRQEALDMRRELGIEDEEKLLLFVGKLESKKNPGILIDAGNPARLVFVGKGKLEQELKARAAAQKRIHFMDFQNQSRMPAIYRMADVLCLPSSGPGETWGLAINEAMACGIKCVISDKCGCAPDLGQFPGNQVFRSGSIPDLREKLALALQNSHPDNDAFLKSYAYVKVLEPIKELLLR
ncbi:MAG: glycosyl transferase family 1 [Bacteroidetes bacterium]|nr:MAG: glycosyl transferase family 1 [Bacteroidota bacterium]